MPGTMLAAVYRGLREMRLEEVPVPTCTGRDVVIRVRRAGICGSDLHSYTSGLYTRSGQVLGHEFAGELVEVGDEVPDLQPGERVTGFGAGFCGECYWCARDQHMLCPSLFRESTGYGKPGAFAEYVLVENAVPGTTVHRVPDHVEDHVAATVEPVSVAVGAVTQAKVRAGDSVVVLGGGIIGNACVQVARDAGADKVVLIEPISVRREAGGRLGADAVFDPRHGDALEWVKEQVGVGPYHFHEGAMADVVIETAGVPQTVVQCFEMVRSGGTIVFVGLPEEPAPVNTTKIVHKAPHIIGSLGGDLGRALELLTSGVVDTASLITHTFDLAEAPEAFETQLRADESVKVMLRM